MVGSLLAWLIGAAQCGTFSADTARSTWETLYESREPGRSVLSVWLGADGSWHAGGKGFLVDGDVRGRKVEDLGPYVAYRVGEDAHGNLLAVGWRLAIWERNGGKWRLVHRSNEPGRSGRASYGEILYRFGYLDPEHPERLVAYGPGDSIVVKQPSGWEQKIDRKVADRARFGPAGSLPVGVPDGCLQEQWVWSGPEAGLLVCRDGRLFSYGAGVRSEAGRLPPSCRSFAAVAADGDELFVACSRTGAVWCKRAEERRFRQVQAPKTIRALHARGGCLLVATERSVARRCGGAHGSVGPGP